MIGQLRRRGKYERAFEWLAYLAENCRCRHRVSRHDVSQRMHMDGFIDGAGTYAFAEQLTGS